MILHETKNEYKIIFGNPYLVDYCSEEYRLKIVNKIKSLMEQGHILILKNIIVVH